MGKKHIMIFNFRIDDLKELGIIKKRIKEIQKQKK